MKNGHTTIFLALFILIVGASFFTVMYADDDLISIISTVSTLLGIVGLLYSFKLDRNISEASFLFDLYGSFRENDSIKNISLKLEDVFLGKETSITEADRRDIVEYLKFFETLASIEKRGVVSIDSFDPLFGYDFFLAIDNEDVKRIELDTYCMYYTETVRLSKKWRRYRIKHKLPIPLNKNS